jgi:hypothetical protein
MEFRIGPTRNVGRIFGSGLLGQISIALRSSRFGPDLVINYDWFGPVPQFPAHSATAVLRNSTRSSYSFQTCS